MEWFCYCLVSLIIETDFIVCFTNKFCTRTTGVRAVLKCELWHVVVVCWLAPRHRAGCHILSRTSNLRVPCEYRTHIPYAGMFKAVSLLPKGNVISIKTPFSSSIKFMIYFLFLLKFFFSCFPLADKQRSEREAEMPLTKETRKYYLAWRCYGNELELTFHIALQEKKSLRFPSSSSVLKCYDLSKIPLIFHGGNYIFMNADISFPTSQPKKKKNQRHAKIRGEGNITNVRYVLRAIFSKIFLFFYCCWWNDITCNTLFYFIRHFDI